MIKLALLLWTAYSFAAIPIHHVGPEKKNRYLDKGVFIGGREQGPLSLLNVRRSFQKETGLERFVFDIASKDARAPVSRPGFFHIAVQKEKNRIVIDLESIAQSNITPVQLEAVLKKSHYFSTATFYYDKITRNLTIEMPFKTKVQVEAFELAGAGRPGRIVLDVKGM